MRVDVRECAVSTRGNREFFATASGTFCYENGGTRVNASFTLEASDKRSAKLVIENAKLWPDTVTAEARRELALAVKSSVKYHLSHALRETVNRACRSVEKISMTC